MTTSQIASILQQQLKAHGLRISWEVALDVAAQLAMCLAADEPAEAPRVEIANEQWSPREVGQ